MDERGNVTAMVEPPGMGDKKVVAVTSCHKKPERAMEALMRFLNFSMEATEKEKTVEAKAKEAKAEEAKAEEAKGEKKEEAKDESHICGTGCITWLTSACRDTLTPHGSPLIGRTGCVHHFHHFCIKYVYATWQKQASRHEGTADNSDIKLTFRFEAELFDSELRLRKEIRIIPTDFCPICKFHGSIFAPDTVVNTTRKLLPYSGIERWMIAPPSIGTIVTKPHFMESCLPNMASVCKFGYIVDVGGYRASNLRILLVSEIGDKVWKKVKDDDDRAFILTKYHRVRGKIYYKAFADIGIHVKFGRTSSSHNPTIPSPPKT